MRFTGLFDCNNKEIKEGDYVALEGITTDNSFGNLIDYCFTFKFIGFGFIFTYTIKDNE